MPVLQTRQFSFTRYTEMRFRLLCPMWEARKSTSHMKVSEHILLKFMDQNRIQFHWWRPTKLKYWNYTGTLDAGITTKMIYRSWLLKIVLRVDSLLIKIFLMSSHARKRMNMFRKWLLQTQWRWKWRMQSFLELFQNRIISVFRSVTIPFLPKLSILFIINHLSSFLQTSQQST